MVLSCSFCTMIFLVYGYVYLLGIKKYIIDIQLVATSIEVYNHTSRNALILVGF